MHMPTYWIPVEGLVLPEEWTVGPVRFAPEDDIVSRLEQPEPAHPIFDFFQQRMKDLKVRTMAGVEATDLDAAIDLVAQGVDVLRLFQHVRYWMCELTYFGLVTEIDHGIVPYVQEVGERSLIGIRRQGESLGWTFSDDRDWRTADAFHWVAGAIGEPSAGEAQRRALIAVQSLSKAIRLARHVAYFGCGRQQDNLCGRVRDTCPYLELDPTDPHQREKLKRLRSKGIRPPWLCSEWHQVVDWYDLRSELVHGRRGSISPKAANEALYWVVRYLVEPILEWLSHHDRDPIGALERDISLLPAGPDWEARLGPL